MKILILGHTGKVGSALMKELAIFQPIGKNSSDFDAKDLPSVKLMLEKENPDIVINCVAKIGFKECEENPIDTYVINSLLPRELANLSNNMGFILIHFSTDNVLDDSDGKYIIETVAPHPMNVYGATKYLADIFIQTIALKYYIFRIPLVFGMNEKSSNEHLRFVENMLYRISQGEKELKMGMDNITSTAYSNDIAKEVKKLVIDNPIAYGLYHLANEGTTSLYEFTKLLLHNLHIEDVKVIPIEYREFTTIKRNIRNPIASYKIKPMRDWKQALCAYCEEIKHV